MLKYSPQQNILRNAEYIFFSHAERASFSPASREQPKLWNFWVSGLYPSSGV
jgi:hypothetical protein